MADRGADGALAGKLKPGEAKPREPRSNDSDVRPRGVSRGAKSTAAKSGFDKKTIALVYDFDGTLSPRPMQDYAFMPQLGEDPAAFWKESNALAKKEGADALITYMHLLYKKAKAKGLRIDRADLVKQGERGRAVPRRRGLVRRDRRLREAAFRIARHRAAPLHRLLGADRDHRGHAHLSSASRTCSPRNTGSTPTSCPSPSASSPTPARRSTCSASTRACWIWARTSTSTCPRPRGPFPSPT